MKKLESWFNPQATKVVENYNHGREMTLDQVNLALKSAINKELKNGEKVFVKSFMRRISQLIVGASKIN
jgi:hypothetical protein